jgi:cobalamin biosynthesis protein CobD/CbiB
MRMHPMKSYEKEKQRRGVLHAMMYRVADTTDSMVSPTHEHGPTPPVC